MNQYQYRTTTSPSRQYSTKEADSFSFGPGEFFGVVVILSIAVLILWISSMIAIVKLNRSFSDFLDEYKKRQQVEMEEYQGRIIDGNAGTEEILGLSRRVEVIDTEQEQEVPVADSSSRKGVSSLSVALLAVAVALIVLLLIVVREYS